MPIVVIDQDKRLCAAIQTLNIKEIESSLDAGANPLTTVKADDGTDVNVFEFILRFGTADCIKKVLDHSKYEILLSDKQFSTDKTRSKYAMNRLQFACTVAPLPVVIHLINHASKTGDVRKILNEKIIRAYREDGVTIDYEVPFGYVLLTTLSTSALISHSEPDLESGITRNDIVKWADCKTQESSPFAGKNPNIIWLGPYKTFEFLLENGMIETVNAVIPGLEITFTDLIRNAKNNPISLFTKLLPLIQMGSITRKGELIEEDGYAAVKITAKNFNGLPQEFLLIFDFSDIHDLVEKQAQAKPGAALITAYKTLAAANDATTAKVAKLKQDVAGLTEIRVRDAKKSLPVDQQQHFDIIYNGVKAKFEAENLRTANVFVTNLRGKNSKNAKRAAKLLQVLALAAPLGSEVLSFAASGISTSIVTRLESNNDAAIFDKAIGMNFAHLAIALATRLSKHVDTTKAAQKASATVAKQYDSLLKYKGESFDDLVNFFCKPVDKKTLVSQDSDSDLSTDTNSPKVALNA